MLYEVAIIHEDDAGKETLVLAPTPILASTEDVAKMIAGNMISEQMKTLNPEELTVLVRPFVE